MRIHTCMHTCTNAYTIQSFFSFSPEFSKAQVAFAGALGNFSFQTIGEQTEDEKMIGGYGVVEYSIAFDEGRLHFFWR